MYYLSTYGTREIGTVPTFPDERESSVPTANNEVVVE
jgi:hypothetical protein